MRSPVRIRVIRVSVAIVAGLALFIGITAPSASAQIPPLPVDLPVDVPELPVDLPVDLPDLGPLTAILECLPGAGLPELPAVGGVLAEDANAAQAEALIEPLLCILSTALEILTELLAGLPAPDVPAPPVPLP